MKYRVYMVAAEYSAPLAILTRTAAEAYRRRYQAPADEKAWQRVFFSAPGQGRSWADLGAKTPPSLTDLLASAAHRALGSFHDLLGSSTYLHTCRSITDLLVASMPLLGTGAGKEVNSGLIPLMLRSMLSLEFDCHTQFVAGTADSGASAFTSAVRIARSRPATVLVSAGQIIPPGYMGQYRIRSVFSEDEQAQGLDMMAMGDALMDALRRCHAAGLDVDRCQDWLATVRQRKMAAASAYPAALGMASSDPASAGRFVTRYFRSADVARAGCGAGAVVITSEPRILSRIRKNLDAQVDRYRHTPVVEIMGAGEGGTNPRVMGRRTPLTAVTPLRQALATAADDAELPLSVYPDSAFAVLHDAFPSMELAFLLAFGLDWQRASLRMTTWWSNPYGGLLAFGHAIGASGLVQVAKAFHTFTGDRRYIPKPLPAVAHFRREGSYAFTTSVGGPLSHIIVTILRGGVPVSARDQEAFFTEAPRPGERRTLALAERRRRKRMSRAADVYAQRLGDHGPGLHLIEATTEIDARSCAQALGDEDIDSLALARLRTLVASGFAGCRAEVIALIRVLRADYLAAANGAELHEARERYNAGLAALIERWRRRGVLRSEAEIQARLSGAPAALDGPPGAGVAAARASRVQALKQCIRVPVAFVIEPGKPGRALRYVTWLGQDGEKEPVDVDTLDFVRAGPAGPGHKDDTLLPWWNSRARRPAGDVSAIVAHASEPDRVFDALMKTRTLAAERHAELVFLRAYFAPFGPQAAVDLAMRDLGVGLFRPGDDESGAHTIDARVPAIFYKNDIIGSSVIANVHEAYELLGRAVQRARGWFGMYASTCAQHGDSVSLVSLDQRLDQNLGPARLDAALHARIEAISNASRFARDVAEWCLGHGIRLRTVVSFGHGMPYRDVNDERSVASDSAIRGARLLDFVSKAAHEHGFAALPWIVFDLTELADVMDAVAIFERELLAASGPAWRPPAGPASPVALDRWDDIRFVVWYRPDPVEPAQT